MPEHCGKEMSERFVTVTEHRTDSEVEHLAGYECECGYKCDTNGEEVEV